MSDGNAIPFLRFLESGIARGGFETDDVLAAVLPLMLQVLALHEQGRVAPLQGIRQLSVTETSILTFDPASALEPKKNAARVEELQTPVTQALEVLGESRRTADIDAGVLEVSTLTVSNDPTAVTKPVYLADYQSWEHAIGHHDVLTDIFSLGMLLASLACGLDFTDGDDLELFATNRANLFAINRRLNPVLASVIVQTTELNRHKRTPDLAQVISRLKNYREQVAEVDVTRLQGFKEAGVSGKRRLIQAHLRDRLFEISRRNRLIYFKPTLHTLNLTIASVPLVLDYRNLKLEQLFVWHRELAATIVEGAPMSLGKYLRFEDAPYIPGVLDKIISEARHDRAEFGFAQLRLVLCFLRWNNLKEAPEERIVSPLLLLPVELTRKKGVRDNYVLDPTSTEAEVNPALRHHLKELYNLNLPETVDLRETSLDQFYESLKAQIHASEPGVTLNKIDRPQIELIHERARQRVDQYRRRMKIKTKARRAARPDYNYDREDRRPLGLQLFIQKVRPTPMPLREAMDAAPAPRLPQIVEPQPPPGDGKTMESESHRFALREGQNQNPYSWDFDLCSLTLGNFNYRKMTLVRDFTNLIETDTESRPFDAIFSLTPRPAEEAPPPAIEPADQHLIIACDATQASAIARARTGSSYIIQGPPGTGKSQTITNLIADYVGCGKRVLFVCEKRAAIDVVYHRLRQQGLDELCCLIHDSQTDKKAFIQNLKQTYEKFLGQPDGDAEAGGQRAATLRAMEQDLASLQRFSEAMKGPHPQAGVPLRRLLHRLVQVRGHGSELPPQVEDLLPNYPLWLAHGEVIERLHAALAELGDETCFARHPLRWLGAGILKAERPLEALQRSLDDAEDSVDAVESALELSGLPGELWDTFEEIQALVAFATKALPLAERDLLGLLVAGRDTDAFNALCAELDQQAQAVNKAQEKAAGWRDPLTVDDTDNALAQARSLENSPLRFLMPAFWRLRKIMRTRYDFSRHAIKPKWSKVLELLANLHQAQAAHEAAKAKSQSAWKTDDPAGFQQLVNNLRTDPLTAHPSVQALILKLAQMSGGPELVRNLAGVQDGLLRLDQTLKFVLAEHQKCDFPGITKILRELRDKSSTLVEILPILEEVVDLPPEVSHAMRHAPVPLNEFEGSIAHSSLNRIYREDRPTNRFDGRILARKMDQLGKRHREWLAVNARCIRASVRQRFLEHVNISSLPASQLDAEQKVFKKSYAAGRRDLEHEFGKSMRYKSIRDLAAGNSGAVVKDLKPIWLMSPLSVSDTLPLDPNYFDVVIFDEASQIPVEEAIPALYRSSQVIVVGDEMQLPPTTFFASSRSDDESVVVEEEGEKFEVDLDSDSFLTQSAANLPSTLLAWHYRSRYEGLISFSNAAFYAGNLYTIPDRQKLLAERPELRVSAVEEAEGNVDALLARSISFHFMDNGVYTDRRNPVEASYIARMVRGLLRKQTGLSIGIVAFSEAQQTEIEDALERLAEEDAEFATQLESEFVREENDQFCGLIVKNLENIQGDERDIILMSVCYGHDAGGRMLMNFGPINQRGGEKRLNVIFSRARHHMALVSSIRHSDITNDYNDGANSLKNFLQYAEAVSKGDDVTARRVLENLNPLARKALAPATREDAVIEALAAALRARGHAVDLNVGQSKFRCDLAVRGKTDSHYRLCILVDTDAHYAKPDLLDRYLMQPGILRAFGWQFVLVLTKDWYHTPEDVLGRIEKILRGEVEEEPTPPEEAPGSEPLPAANTAPEAPPHAAAPVPPTAAPTPVPPPQKEAQRKLSRRLEYIGGGSQKFWEVTVEGNSFTVHFGRLGTAGQSQTKSFADEATALREAERLIGEKLAKGYEEKPGV